MKGRLTYKMFFGTLCALVFSCQKTTDNLSDFDNLKRLADEVNTIAPRNIDESTRLDSAGVKQPNILLYYYTIREEDSTVIDIQRAKEGMRAAAQANLDTLKGKQLFKGHIVMQYVYRDTLGKPLFDFSINTKKKK